ncbi:arginine-tRNA-protein transferase [Lipomyces japonicus]|uniref:arginine-tRNA-protein transferase n=1 Tax=Lipomyces japonicus TaxID=56871 RepID=UPI0034CDE6A9
MIFDGNPVTAVNPGQYVSGRPCGYCHSDESAIYGFSFTSLTVEHYQLLLERGLRRSGTFMYKPDLLNSCCPQYAIRLEASKFKPSKEHRQALHRFNRHILGEEYEKEVLKFESSRSPKKSKNEFSLSKAIHRAEHHSLLIRGTRPKHKFEVKLVEPDGTDEKFLLYKHYQITCHKDKEEDVTRHGFERFLCGGRHRPFELGYNQYDENLYRKQKPIKRLGLWHQMYYVDDELIAMAVLDFLPDTISSVYFMYREDYSHFSLGKVSACRENLLAFEEGRKYYYLGLYIYSCQKMKYKASFSPSELLDPELYKFFSYTKFQTEFEKSEYVSFKDNHLTRLSSDSIRRHHELDRTSESDLDNYEEKSLFQVNMPGIISRKEAARQVDISLIRMTAFGRVIPFSKLQEIYRKNNYSIAPLEDVFLELVAVLGKDVVIESIVRIANGPDEL